MGAMINGNGEGQVEYIGPRGLINRHEYIRLLTQSLYSLGYPDIAKLLEEQSGIVMQPHTATDFRDAILNGNYEAAVALLPQLAPNDADKERARFLILRHKYIECLHRGDTPAALRCLRLELQPLESAASTKVIQSLAAMLLHHPLSSPNTSNGHTNGASQPSSSSLEGREDLLSDLQPLLPPSVLVPEARLEELIEQALLAQLDRCPYHNSSALHMSLLSDYVAGPEQLPTECSQVLTAHTDEVWWIEFSRDGRYMASGSKDGSALLWIVDPLHQVAPLKPIIKVGPPVSLATFSPDSQKLLISTANGMLHVYKVPSGEFILETVAGPAPSGQPIAAAGWLPDSRHVFALDDRNLMILDMEQGGVVTRRLRQSQHIYDAVLSGDGGTVVMVGQDRRLQFLRLEDAKEASVGPENVAVTCLSASPDGRFVAANLANGVIHLWPLGDLRAPGSENVSDRPGANDPLDALPAGPLQEYRWGEDRPGRYVIRSALGGAGCGFLSSGSEDGRVYIWHREGGSQLAEMSGHGGTVNTVAWNPRNQHMLASGSDDKTIRIWLAPAVTGGGNNNGRSSDS